MRVRREERLRRARLQADEVGILGVDEACAARAERGAWV